MIRTFDWFYTIWATIMMALIFTFVIICSAVAGTFVFVSTIILCVVSFVFVIYGFVIEYKHDKKWRED